MIVSWQNRRTNVYYRIRFLAAGRLMTTDDVDCSYGVLNGASDIVYTKRHYVEQDLESYEESCREAGLPPEPVGVEVVDIGKQEVVERIGVEWREPRNEA